MNSSVLAVLTLRSTITNDKGLLNHFDKIMKRLFNRDVNFDIRNFFDILVQTQQLSSSEADVIYCYLFANEGEDDINDILIPLLLAYETIDIRNIPMIRERMNWDDHARLLCSENKFRRMYRMDLASFNKLVKLIEHDLYVDRKQSRCRTGVEPASTEVMFAMTIRYLAGGSIYDICANSGVSASAFYPIIYRVMHGICNCKELAMKFPKDLSECERAAASFKGKSTDGLMDRCVSCVDGWLCHIQVPRWYESANITGFFSGHYQCYGLNVQAACDAECKFTYFSVKCPGGTNDSFAFSNCKLNMLIENLPHGYWVAGDNAYVLTEKMLVPYSGRERHHPSKSVFNFYLCQLRIRIEQAFGLLVNKWRIFKRPLECHLNHVSLIIHTSMMLHNYCITERLQDISIIESPESFIPAYHEYLETDCDPYSATNPKNRNMRMTGKTREAICAMLHHKGVVRPAHNISQSTGQGTLK